MQHPLYLIHVINLVITKSVLFIITQQVAPYVALEASWGDYAQASVGGSCADDLNTCDTRFLMDHHFEATFRPQQPILPVFLPHTKKVS